MESCIRRCHRRRFYGTGTSRERPNDSGTELELMSALDMLGFGGHPHHPGERFGLEDGEKAGATFRDFIRHLFA